MSSYDIVIIGGGPAGLAAAAGAREQGIESILILERDRELGGILNQCIHNGFGLHTFKEELTGPEYAARFVRRIHELKIEYKLDTMVVDIRPDRDAESACSVKKVTAVNHTDGMFVIDAKAVILAMGCRERPRGALNIPGFRPSGIFSAGTAQRLVNIDGCLPGREVVILGSGDIGLIMARRMTLEGAKVKVVAELMPYSGGLKRNIVQCLDDYNIPLKLSHTVIDIRGKKRLEGVTIARVDERGKPVPGTEEYYSCDTLLLSVGLIPENELSDKMGIRLDPVTRGPVVNESLETSQEGVFACGNVLHVHDLVDYVSEEAAAAGIRAALYVRSAGGISPGMSFPDSKDDTQSQPPKETADLPLTVCPSDGVRYIVPALIRPSRMPDELTFRFRVDAIYRGCSVNMYLDDKRIRRRTKLIMTPGEMEEIKLFKKDLAGHPDAQRIILRIERTDKEVSDGKHN